MICEELTNARFSYIGLFTSQEEWIHPSACESTYEIIYVTGGEVWLQEGTQEYGLQKGDLILLKPGVVHYGSRTTVNTSFYWLHFWLDRAYDTTVIKGFHSSSLFKELMHYSHMPNCPEYAKQAVLWHLLSEISMCHIHSDISTLGQSVFEWTRINVSRSLTVTKVAEHFRYNSEYLSRLIHQQYGVSLKGLIDDFLIEKAREYLCNTDESIKEISHLLGFSSANTFVNFFKYHEKISPNRYRNSYSYIHMNKR